MQRYWDVEEKDRMKLTKEEVESLIDVELMENGLVRPTAPTLETEPDMPELESVTMYGIECEGSYHGSRNVFGLLFETAEDAGKFLELNFYSKETEYFSGPIENKAFAKKPTGMAVVPEKVHEHQVIINAKAQLEEISEIRKRNEKLQEEHNEMLKGVSDASEGIWEDYYKLLRKVDKYQEVKDTYAKYIEIAQGDEFIAFGFLCKAFDFDACSEAFDFNDMVVPAGITIQESEEA